MSITFFAPDSPIKATILQECYCVADGQKDSSCTNCNDEGMEEVKVPEVPELNLSNSNAKAIQEVLGYEPDYCGKWEATQLGTVRQKIMVASNSKSTRSTGISEFRDSSSSQVTISEEGLAQISKGCRIIEAGRSDEYLVAKLSLLDETVAAAQRLGLCICWG